MVSDLWWLRRVVRKGGGHGRDREEVGFPKYELLGSVMVVRKGQLAENMSHLLIL